MTTLAAQLQDPARGIVIDDRGSDVALIAFGGLLGFVGGVPPFEFLGLARDLDASLLFIRDRGQVWYRNGVPGLGADLPTVSDTLRSLVAELDVAPVLIGASAGGFAAIACAVLAGFPLVHALVPQTTISRGGRLRIADRRFSESIRKTRTSRVEPFIRDLRPLLADGGVTSVHVHVAADCREDIAHARRIGRLQKVTTHVYPEGGHTLAKRLRDGGQLRAMVTDGLDSVRRSRTDG